MANILRVIRTLLLVLLCGAVPAAACVVTPRTSVPLEPAAGHVLVTALLNGQPAQLVLDTGAERTMVTPAAVRRLGLALDRWVGTTIMGIGGMERHQNAVPTSFELGGVPLQHPTVLHDASLAVGRLPLNRIGRVPVDGLLGRDFLAAFDVLIDVPGRRLTLYLVRDCSGNFLPWRIPYAAIPTLSEYGRALAVPVQVDGRALRALLDTGASRSLIIAPGMARLGLTPDRLIGDVNGVARGIGRSGVTVQAHRFDTLLVGNQALHDPVLLVSPVRVVPTVDMLLGLDWLQAHQIWLSYSTMQVFVGG
ncbi:MAG TPA: retroviral-like aspartic protease family protein [Acetobacteraceae bacterium]|nr:retroviral-like aspartic protease family protein [Acetobacteraceae bacterium]